MDTFLPVHGLTPEEWERAIGSRDGVERIEDLEDAELGPCCERISDARDLLMKCLNGGGLHTDDAQQVQRLIEDHGGMWFFRDGPLAHIFTQLRIKMCEWEDQQRRVAPDFLETKMAKTYAIGDLD